MAGEGSGPLFDTWEDLTHGEGMTHSTISDEDYFSG
jgi:hypothetical protein